MNTTPDNPPDNPSDNASAAPENVSAAPDNNLIWETLKTIPDPEYGISIVDMGLIYAVECKDGDIAVTMTLTTQNCPSGEWIHEGVKTALNGLAGAKNVEVTMVFDPPWTPDKLSADGQRQLGMG